MEKVVWDCGSSLYDSFELNSLKHQLDSAISSRSLSMPHLVSHNSNNKKPSPSSKISRSVNKLLRSLLLFRPNKPKPKPKPMPVDHISDPIFVVYDKSGSLTTIPEAPELIDLGSFSPEIGSLVTRTGSDRFTAATTSIGISCPRRRLIV